jgi:hypothetical protein
MIYTEEQYAKAKANEILTGKKTLNENDPVSLPKWFWLGLSDNHRQQLLGRVDVIILDPKRNSKK